MSHSRTTNAVGDILSGMQGLVFAKQAGARTFVDNEALLDAADSLATAYQVGVAERTVYCFSRCPDRPGVGCTGLMAKIYLDDTCRQGGIGREEPAGNGGGESAESGRYLASDE